MCKIISLLSKHLNGYRSSHHFILSTDGYRAHLTRPVWRAVNRARIMYHLIPAKITWVLQPCDTHVFSVLKNTLRRECQVLALTQPNGRTSMSLLFRALARTISLVLRGVSWRCAFQDLGLTGVQAAVSDRVLGKLQLGSRPTVASELPTLQELQAIFPARSILPIDDIFGWFTFSANTPVREQSVAAAAAAVSHDHAAVDPLRPWFGRTRSSSSQPPPASQPAPLACPLPAMSSTAPMTPSPQPPRMVPRGRRLLPWRPRHPTLPPPAPPPP